MLQRLEKALCEQLVNEKDKLINQQRRHVPEFKSICQAEEEKDTNQKRMRKRKEEIMQRKKMRDQAPQTARSSPLLISHHPWMSGSV